MLFIDIETFSTLDLRKASVYRYVEDPLFEIMMAAWAEEDGPVQVAIGREAIEAIPGLLDPAVTKVAHNAAFERVCFSAFLGLPTGSYLPPEHWLDTMALAAEWGYPRGLANLAVALGAEEKDEAGTLLVNFWCKPNRKGQRNLPGDHPDRWKAFVEYCRQDVATLRGIFRRLPAWPTPMEELVYLTDQRINDRGMQVDVSMARAAQQAAEDNRWEHELEFSALTGVANPGSGQQVLAWVKEQGLPMKNLQAETVERTLLRSDLTDPQRRALELRQELALVAAKKYPAALLGVNEDDRLRGGFRFYGAHTGRWSGRGVQPHNMPREQFDDELETELAILRLKDQGTATALELKQLVRALFVGPFTVVDYAAIEARVLAWLAGEDWALEAFRAGRDIYTETARRMGGLTRSQGKVAVLALGYNGGVKSLRAMGYGGRPCSKALGCKEDEDAAISTGWRTGGTVQTAVDDGDGVEHRCAPELVELVRQWRDANESIQSFWWDFNDVFRTGGALGEYITVERDGDDRLVWLPSGRALCYRRTEFPWVHTPSGKRKRQPSFFDPVKGVQVRTYGGRLTENVTQAVARDVLAEALVRLEQAGLRTVAHVHDEIIVETQDMDQVLQIMVQPPSWAGDLPINGEAFTCDRYRKG